MTIGIRLKIKPANTSLGGTAGALTGAAVSVEVASADGAAVE